VSYPARFLRGLDALRDPSWLVDWAKDQDRWVRCLVERVLDHQGGLPTDALEAVYSTLLIARELAQGELPVRETFSRC
jgi:hypothetical protein